MTVVGNTHRHLVASQGKCRREQTAYPARAGGKGETVR